METYEVETTGDYSLRTRTSDTKGTAENCLLAIGAMQKRKKIP